MEKKRYSIPVTMLYVAGIIAYMLFFLFVVTRGEWNCFLTDDNAMEWEPVARACFDEFFATGKIPYFDFYQYKGFDVYMEGYYGQNNPVMFLCYCISRFIFSFRIGVTSLYVILSAILGVLAMFWLLRECEVRHTTMLLTLFGYSCCTFFYLYGFYYFTFNNYWFIPFLLWSILKIKDTRFVWFIPGILLAFSLLLGHVQYTFYYCIVYGIVMIMLALRSRKPGLFLSAFTNAALFLALSLPNLMTQMKAGELREYVLEVFGNEFLSQPIDSFCIFVPQIAEKLWGVAQAEERSSYQLYIGMGIFSILAFVIFLPLLRSFFDDLHRWISENKKLQNFMSSVEKKSSTKELRILKYLLVSILFLLLISKVITFYFERYVSAEMYALLYILAASVCVLICVLASVLSKKDFMISFRFLKKLVILVTFSYPFLFTILAILYSCYLYKKHRIMEVSSVHSIAWGAMAAALFFVFFSMGTKTPVAMILSHIPVISGFRFLYKCGFIFIPLLFFVGAVVLDTMKLSGREIKSLSAVSIALSLISFVNLFSFFATDNHQYIRNSRLLLLPEMNAYVEQTDRLMEEQQIDRNNYRYISFADYSSYQKMDWAYYSNTVTFTRYTKNASTAIRFFSITGYDNSYSRTCFEQSDHIITKLGDFAMCQNIASPKDFFSSADEEEYKEIFEKQMIDNAVKYVIAGKYDISTQQKFEELIDRCEKLSILRKFDGLDGTMFYELDGVDQLVSTASGKQIDLDPGLSELKFTTDLDTPENITLSFTYDSRYRLALTDANGRQSFCPLTENEDGYLQAEIPEGIYSARLFYKDDMTEISMVFSLVTYILMILAYICTITRKSMKKQ